jgi:DNA (cytosine-5)-methyltransferase 1
MRLILAEIEKIGYKINYKLLNAADYGVPQVRERIVMLGSRDGGVLDFPKPTHSKTGDNGLKKWVTLKDALDGLNEIKPEFFNYSETRLKYLRQVPMGGNWRSLPVETQREALGGAYESSGGKVGFYRRLDWNKPSPTVTTSPHQKATDMCHPELDRPLTVRECARIQQFPDSWLFVGNKTQKYKQIGNAVPISLNYALGQSVYAALKKPLTIVEFEGKSFHSSQNHLLQTNTA